MENNDLKVMFFLAYKNLTKSKITFMVIVAVMAMSFLSITFFASIIDGLGYEFEEGMIRGQTGHLMIEPQEDELYISGSGNLVKDIRRIPGVVGVARRLDASAVARYETIEIGNPVLFIEPENEKDVSDYWNSIIVGEYLSKRDTAELLIGANLVKSYAAEGDTQKRFDVDVGDKITLSFSNGFVKEYRIKGIYKTGSRFVDDKIILNFDQYQLIFGSTDDIASNILIALPQRGMEEPYTEKIIDLGLSEQINKWQTKMGAVNQFVGSLQITNQITGTIGLLTAFATIYIIIFINVTNKRKQIGILKAVGIKKQIILGSYVLQSLAYGITGVIIGNIVMKLLLILLSIHPLSMPIGQVVPILTTERLMTTSATLILASIVAGFFPSRKAADENILDAIFGG
ncbi:ABC-type transport system, involved in lipoprotein release, permease component [Methanomethylovorans hollandica DSM 15978]|uniref:ABC-type transport system, involved in lipoprotein release, permease component n=1 Tax=Methanomethylovorans hollandica (strain DSM 15978 / NBRC 107637 / DMS1) TaxID=867904 RepID=L0KZZ2_METHD|nr:FtsX-like permease family protein [Methanomethylovorans hollandica]AGB49569.1 ABC-type transport system, involved in lipoprotein release, permease component [Methanomethylovorans hollandica DSM 15978]